MGDIMPEKRKRLSYKIFNWIDEKLDNFVEVECNFCKKPFIVTKTEFRTAKGRGSCSDDCAGMMLNFG